jgi:hypothetical protein
MDINQMAARSGKVLKSDNTVVNQADMIEFIYKALVVDKNAGMSLTGSNEIKIKDSGGNSLFVTSSVGDNNPGAILSTGNYALNSESKWDRWRNNTEGTLLARATRTAYTKSPFTINHNAKGIHVHLRIYTTSGTGGLTVNLGSSIPNGGEHWIAKGVSVSVAGVYTLELYPGVANTTAMNVNELPKKQDGSLPKEFYVAVSHGDSSIYDYELTYSLIL